MSDTDRCVTSDKNVWIYFDPITIKDVMKRCHWGNEIKRKLLELPCPPLQRNQAIYKVVWLAYVWYGFALYKRKELFHPKFPFMEKHDTIIYLYVCAQVCLCVCLYSIVSCTNCRETWREGVHWTGISFSESLTWYHNGFAGDPLGNSRCYFIFLFSTFLWAAGEIFHKKVDRDNGLYMFWAQLGFQVSPYPDFSTREHRLWNFN